MESLRTMGREWAGPRIGTPPTGLRTEERFRRWRSRSISSGLPNSSSVRKGWVVTLPHNTGLLRAAYCPTPRVLADRERTRRCRSLLRPRWRRPSFWRVVRRPSGWARSPTQVRSPAPTAPAAESGSLCFAVVAGGLRALLLLRPERNMRAPLSARD